MNTLRVSGPSEANYSPEATHYRAREQRCGAHAERGQVAPYVPGTIVSCMCCDADQMSRQGTHMALLWQLHYLVARQYHLHGADRRSDQVRRRR